MRFLLSTSLLLALACSGGADLATTAAPTKDAHSARNAGAELGEHYLVILASKKDPAEVTAALNQLATLPDTGAHPGTLSSSRFKNLMPCYTVAYADATTDKKAALSLSKTLKAAGVDNYVKNTGKWIGPSAALDAYCASPEHPANGDVMVATYAGDSLWLPVHAAESALEAALAGAPDPVSMGDQLDAYLQPATTAPAGITGSRYHAVNATTGEAVSCTAGRVAVLTLGTPHYSVQMAEEKPTAPTCGAPALYAELQCGNPKIASGSWVVVPEATPIVGYTPAGEVAGIEDQAKAALAASSDFEVDPDLSEYEGDTITRSVKVTRWTGPTGDVALVQGTLEILPGICGGDVLTYVGLYAINGQTLGAALGPVLRTGQAFEGGVLDIGGDGRPEFVLDEWLNTVSVYEGATLRGSLELAYCDCPC